MYNSFSYKNRSDWILRNYKPTNCAAYTGRTESDPPRSRWELRSSGLLCSVWR